MGETINLMKIANSLDFKRFLIMPPAYYKYRDEDAIKFYTKIIDAVPESKIILYNFEKLCGYKFSIECIERLVQKFPNQIIGVKDSSYNLFDKLKLKNFSVLPGSESKLLKGLELGWVNENSKHMLKQITEHLSQQIRQQSRNRTGLRRRHWSLYFRF